MASVDPESVKDAVCRAYYDLLMSVDWTNDVLIGGLREGLTKFPSNAWLYLLPGSKYHKTQWISEPALRLLHQGGALRDMLRFEHVVPKDRFQRNCEERVRDGSLTLDYVREMFERYWLLATVTKEEDKRLPRRWDGSDAFVRYRCAGIQLVRNPFFAEIS